ncbi:MAG: metallophosphoesterase [Sporomusa sp.]|jgi:phosphodiesterase/alkaline phosphatase D-like protein|nr:metallophosphoesterase [Sporomusa sp.]
MLRLKSKHIALIIILVTILSGLPAVPFLSTSSLATAYPEQITVISTNNPQTSQTITWRMDAGTGGCHLQYAESSSKHPSPYDVKTITVEATNLLTADGLIHTYSSTISRLKPGTSYFYRVGYGNIWSEWRTFITAE